MFYCTLKSDSFKCGLFVFSSHGRLPAHNRSRVWHTVSIHQGYSYVQPLMYMCMTSMCIYKQSLIYIFKLVTFKLVTKRTYNYDSTMTD